MESAITNTKEVYTEGASKPRFDYLFSPFNFGKALGGVFGSFNQITKNENNEYRKKQLISFTKASNKGDISEGSKFEIEEVIFLKDPNDEEIVTLKKNTTLFEKDKTIIPLSTKTGTFTSPDNAVIINYSITTYAKHYFDQIPDSLSNKPKIDGHLKKHKDILHTVDEIRINKITLTEKSSNKLVLEADVKIEPTGGSRLNIDLNNEGRDNGDFGLNASGSIIGSIDTAFGTIDNINIWSLDELDLIFNAQQLSKICESVGNIKINSELFGGPIELVSGNGQVFLTTDQYWAKGVGSIKNITTYKKIFLKANAKDYLTTKPFNFDVKRIDPNCGLGEDDESQYYDTTGIDATISLKIEELTADIPFILTKEIVIQNLKNYTIRNTLN